VIGRDTTNVSELPDIVEDRLKLLSEVNMRLGDLIQFNIEHPGHWTPAEIGDYNKLRIAWNQALVELSSFEDGRTAM
jgi:hypothetical protein